MALWKCTSSPGDGSDAGEHLLADKLDFAPWTAGPRARSHAGWPNFPDGSLQVCKKEWLRRRRANFCLFCWGGGHFISSCPVRASGWAGRIRVSPTTLSPFPHRPLLHARLLLPGVVHTRAILVDSGADVCIIGREMALQLDLGQIPLSLLFPARALNGHYLKTIAYQTGTVLMLLSGNCHGNIQFHILELQ